MLSNEGTVLASAKYITTEQDTPVLDLNNGTFEPQDNDIYSQDRTKSADASRGSSFLKKFTLTTHSFPNIHKKVKDMLVD